MSVWDAVADQPTAVAVLRGAVAGDAVAHAWLLVGPRGSGQRELGRALAAALNCPTPVAPGEPCGTCLTCTRLLAGTHTAGVVFEPEGAMHLVDAVRDEWMLLATRTLLEGDTRVLTVASADLMNEPAQNAFLKVLEEPPGRVVWLLEAEDEGALLETLVSRCQRLALRTRTVNAALDDPDRVAARARHAAAVDQVADAGPTVAIPLARTLEAWTGERVKARDAANAADLQLMEEAYGGEWPPGARVRAQKRLDRLKRQERTDAFGVILEDMATRLRERLAGDGDSVATGTIDALAAIEECRDAIDRNGQPLLQLERALLRIGLALARPGVAAR